ncbi:hypothetical protein GLOTRDRAFT_44756 [Gloeophyllum trabeum ATCC 11539]|uniref:Uncharacterized protein n=1 Tax=Gloeophyllum trabeum (strain ATCC 11539 / FP-39264 / Madison 617) TaxID=670483 RepID=S7RLK9_GLOTA|nr:uncharacterized protein GLOTRDRAFT_44756 [Gloeophyllum trabeum ATCC 11539]EPQ53554.1 hypothetical protein GLOTRDRAFT_44756 [Gloeophyllum trabeum ATCC 11539]
MSPQNPSEPPTESARQDARRCLDEKEKTLGDIEAQLESTQHHLQRVVAELRAGIDQLELERSQLQHEIAEAKSTLAPVWRLPRELLREIFLVQCEEVPGHAWIRLVTDETTSPDVLRLWLERAGPTIPLDIEIYLRAQRTPLAPYRSRSPSPIPSFAPPQADPAGAVTYVHGAAGGGPIQVIPIPQGPVHPTHPGSPPPTPSTARGRSRGRHDDHWGHIAFFYLVEQIHRWERFLFRFDKHFTSISALKSINKNAPLLKEFEVSCANPGFFGDWTWIATDINAPVRFTRLQALTLQYIPFHWSSPILRHNLTSLSIRALPNPLSLDRILGIITANPALEKLALHFNQVLPPVLPLNMATLVHLKDLTLGGHHHFSILADHLITPSLTRLALDIEARDPIEDTITNLLARSNNPPLTHFALAYANSGSYYFSGSIVSWGFLADLPFLKSLKVGGAAFETFLMTLASPDEDHNNQWICPGLTTLGLKSCHGHQDGLGKLVQLIDARNPEGGGVGPVHAGVSPARLKKLEILECVPLGQDIVSWLKRRVDRVIWAEPPYDRASGVQGEYLDY